MKLRHEIHADLEALGLVDPVQVATVAHYIVKEQGRLLEQVLSGAPRFTKLLHLGVDDGARCVPFMELDAHVKALAFIEDLLMQAIRHAKAARQNIPDAEAFEAFKEEHAKLAGVLAADKSATSVGVGDGDSHESNLAESRSSRQSSVSSALGLAAAMAAVPPSK